MGISDKSLEKLKNHTNVSWIKKDTFTKGYRDSSIFPQNPSFDWNNDFFGPIYIPQKNKSIEITKANLPIYKRLIEVYENNKLEIRGGEIYINGIQTNEYKFKQDYYWLMGDNRSNSQDSRTWGFVPFDHVVGKPVFKWLSIDYNAKGFNKIRWNRMFTTVHGKGKPNSYLIHFIVVMLGWYFFSLYLDRSRK
jgi:signal peptidase I